jgi:hypothetical protein
LRGSLDREGAGDGCRRLTAVLTTSVLQPPLALRCRGRFLVSKPLILECIQRSIVAHR